MKHLVSPIIALCLFGLLYVLLNPDDGKAYQSSKPSYSYNPQPNKKSWGDSIDEVIERERQARNARNGFTPVNQSNSQNSNVNSNQSRGKYHYHVVLSDWHREWETYETEELIDGTVRMKKVSSPNVEQYNGTYDWYMDTYLPDETAMANYIINNFSRMRQYKVSQNMGSQSQIRDVDRHYSNDADEFNYKIDDYFDDPEDEITFPPEVFDYLMD